jgi:hypothetical protein
MTAAALLGLGAGATVSPGLYLAGLSLPSRIIGRIFALVELVRSVADFIISPIMVELAGAGASGGGASAAGIRDAIWITLGVTLAMTLFGVGSYLLGNVGLPLPDVQAWIEGSEPAFRSPPLAGAVRESD